MCGWVAIAFDDSLLARVNDQMSNAARVLECRLSWNKIERCVEEEKTVISCSDTLEFLKKWHTACRSLFSNESLSLRNIKQLIDIKETLSNDTKSMEQKLAEVLLQKMPMLRDFCCHQFVHYFLQLFKEVDTNKLIPEKETSPVRLLVRAALIDREDDLCSYAEYISQMKGSHELHPIARLSAWTRARFKNATGTKLPLDNLRCLGKLTLIDQEVFPLILDENANSTNLSSCHGFCRRGDYTDLHWMADSVEHKCSIDWDQARRVWERHHITSAKDLAHLISVCPVSKQILFLPLLTIVLPSDFIFFVPRWWCMNAESWGVY